MTLDVFPGQSESITDFLKVAERLDGGQIKEAELTAAVAGLPELTEGRLVALGDHAQAQAHLNPRFGWAIARVADESAVKPKQQINLELKAKAAWYLGRAANSYSRPQQAFAALRRARTAFVILEDEAWAAACDWQQHVLAWAKPDLHFSVAEVQAAFDIFSSPNASLAAYRDECCLTLAYIHTLIGNYSESYMLLEDCESIFKEQQNQLGLINCHLIRGNAFGRQSKFEDAIKELEACIDLAQAINAPVFVALGKIQLGSVLSKHSPTPGSYQDAEATFLEAADHFKRLDLSFWEALCQDGLSAIYISRGNLSLAGEALASCRQIYREFKVNAPLAGALIGSGWLETYRANYEQGLVCLSEAETISKQLGNKFMLGLSHMHLGEIYLEMGRYQQSLHFLEKAIAAFQKLDSPGRMAESGLRLARCWTYLGRSILAQEALEQVEKNAEEAKQGNIFPYLYIRQAESFFLAAKQPEAVEALEKAILAAVGFEDNTGAALAQRLLGEALCDLERLSEAAICIDAAEKTFNEVGLVIEQAACKIAWGQYYRKSGDAESARKVLQQAAERAENLAPDIIWQAEAGLASLAEDVGNDSEALGHYRRAIEALVRLRQDMWQPALAGYFLKRPIDTINSALRLAVRVGSSADVLDIIEAGKAQIMANLFQKRPLAESNDQPPELVNLAADIRWRQEKARASRESSSWLPTADLRKLRLEIQEMVKAYDLLQSRIERQSQTATVEIRPKDSEFDLAQFRQTANQKFGKNWLALDYYLTPKNLTCVLISSHAIEYIDLDYTGRVRMAFAEIDQAQLMGHWSKQNLQVLGNWLLPSSVVKALIPETVLLIAPHSELHRLPWSALMVDGQPLVTRSVPVVVPSMQSLAVLMARPDGKRDFEKGLLIAASDFKERHIPLSQTVKEVESLLRLFPESESLIGDAATWDGLLNLKNEAGLSDYSFLHFASHAFVDKLSGRLSGLAFSDRDVWLDELWDCAPLPSLVTLSACSGSKSRLYEGDEQVGLATTCLAAGARQIVASLWPIQDKEAISFMSTFYSHLMLGSGTALALAKAQRAAIKDKKDVTHWAGFRCTGLPE